MTIKIIAYKVEVEAEGCEKCGHGKLYRVVGPDDVSQSVLYEDESEAEHLADVLNDAYEKGIGAVK